MLTVSERGKRFPPSPIRKLVPFADEAKARGTRVFHLNIGQPDIATPAPMLEAIRNFNAPTLAYGPAAGLPELREAKAAYLARDGIHVDPSNVFVTTGGSEALLFALTAVADVGDQVLVPEPFYANYAGFCAMLGIELVGVPTRFEDGFHLPDNDVFLAHVTPRTRAIITANPGNPTGTVYTRAELERFSKIFENHPLFWITDEVYREFVYDGQAFSSALSFQSIRDRVIFTDSISKRFSACGARIGFLITTHPDIMQAVTRIGFARLCPPTIGQYAAIAGYRMPPSYFDAVISEYTTRRNALLDGLTAIEGVRCYRPEGAFYMMLKLPVDDADRFATWLLSDFAHDGETVMLAPGSGFYSDAKLGRQEARIAYVLRAPDLVRSAELLQLALARYPGRES